jgi:cell division protein FtsN
MLKQIIGYLLLLVAAGTGLTLYLPDYEPDNGVSTQQQFYQIDQPSLKEPLPMADTLLSATEPPGSAYGLRLGLFSQLQQAIGQGQKLALADNPTIVKLTDQQRYWYLLMLGPYDSTDIANQQRYDMARQHGISATLMKWPMKDGDVEQAK